MVNTTFTGENIDDSTFNAILPASNETLFVEYFFETEDYLGNIDNTSDVNFYYADGSGPTLDTLLIYPSIISNYTQVQVLFNCSDYVETRQSVVFYRFENQSTWNPIGANEIDYTRLDHYEIFTAKNLRYIKDIDVSSFPLRVILTGLVDTATLSFEITHEMPTDLRVWLVLDDGRKFMIFNRETGSSPIIRHVDLIKLGITEIDFTRVNFTLEIRNFSEYYSGKLIEYEIELSHHETPLGYQYVAFIDPTDNDTTVFFYVNMTDNLWNSENTSVFHYYSDGLAPNINVVYHNPSLNVAGAHSIRIFAQATDKRGIFGVDAYYKFSESESWSVDVMSLNATSGEYFFDVPISTTSGTMFYKIRAFDLSGLSSETGIYNTTFSGGLGPGIIVEGLPYPSPLDMEDKNTIRIWANVTDDGNITNCTIAYGFTDTAEMKSEDMLWIKKLALIISTS